MEKYLKTYTSITSGTIGGREDGYPYTQTQLHENIEVLAKNYGTKEDEKYYILEAVNEEEFEQKIQEIKERLEKEEKEEKRKTKLNELERLKTELGENY